MSFLSLVTPEPGSRVTAPAGAVGRAQTIGVLSFDPTGYGTASALAGVQEATRATGHCVSIVSLAAADSNAFSRALKRLRRLRVEGVLALAPPRTAIEPLAALAAELPIVAVGGAAQDVLPVLRSDHYAGAAAATRHLLELGHRYIVHISGTLEPSASASALAGWRDTLLEAGTEVPMAMVGEGSPERGYELGRQLGPRRDVTAIFAGSDQMALGLLRALFELGRRVPQEMSVVGFGDVPEAEFFNPPLTTVRQDLAELGRRGVGLLRAASEGARFQPAYEPVPVELVVRASTAAV